MIKMLFYLGWNDFGKSLGLAIEAPPKAFLETTLLATGMERKRKGGSSDLPARFFLRLAKKNLRMAGNPQKNF